MGGIAKAFLLLVIFMHYDTGFGSKQNKVFERLDDLELDVLTERNERRKILRKIENSLENIEGRLNISLAQEGPSGVEMQHFERQLNEMKELLGNTKLAEIFETFHELRKGFNSEKKQSLRFRRRVSQIEDVLVLLSNNSDTLTRNMFAFSEDLRQTNEGLRETNEGLRETNEGLKETNKIMKEMYENTSNALLHVTDVLHAMTTNTVNAVGSVVERTIYETMAKYSLEFRQETSLRETTSHPTVQESRPKSCLELLKSGHTESDVYSVFLGDHTIKVFCDQERDGGGWTVFQRRQDGSVDFFRNWVEYRNGFGDLHGEFWLGNENLHRLLSVKGRYELRVDLGDFDGNTTFAKYNRFMVGSENENYVLTVERYSGDAGESLDYHNGQKFSTKDRDNDRSSGSCSQKYKGAWWYNACYSSNLNGLYNTDKQSTDPKNICWWHWKGRHPLKFTEMKFRELV